MAGRRNKRDAREVLVARHQARRKALEEDLAAVRGRPADQVAAAAAYLRGAMVRTDRDLPAEVAATGRDVVQLLTSLGDQLFRAAIEKRRSSR